MNLALRKSCCSALLALSLLCSSSARGQTPPFECGPDCSQPGRFVLCVDDFDTNQMVGGTVELGPIENACVTIAAPASSFRLTGFAAVFGGGATLPVLVELYEEVDRDQSAGAKLFDTGAQIPFGNMIQASGLFFAPQTLTDEFRLCLRTQFDDPFLTMGTRPIAFDANGQQGLNTMILQGPGDPTHGNWRFAADANVTGDFILRAVVEHTEDMTPWQPGGVCDQTPSDAGVAPDFGTQDANDNGPPDVGDQNRPDGGDAAIDRVDAQFPADTGVVTPPVDSGVIEPAPDATPSNSDAPIIDVITPREGLSTQSTEIIVTGRNFQDGATIKIGAIPADAVEVPGPSTLLATVPRGIVPGVYDVIVQNPDGQADVEVDGFTILGEDEAPVEDEGCGCSVSETRSGAGWTAGVFGLWALLMIRRRR